MCLIVLAWRARPDFPLIVAANRDEFHARPAARAAFWQDQPSILGGRDLEAGGTWMGVSRGGRFAAVTNYRGGREPRARESRGALVSRFLLEDFSPEEYVKNIPLAEYSGFNLLACDGDELWWLSNRDSAPRCLKPGIYGLGNLLLDTPEVSGPKADFERSIAISPATESLFLVLEKSKILASEYGTRCSTLLLLGEKGRIQFAERAFDASGAEGPTVRFGFPARR
jgi:uncharacterized protein with NRDE domain